MMFRGVLAALAVAGVGLAAQSAGAADKAMANLEDRDGKAVGQVELMQTANGVLLKATIDKLVKGTHAFHVHAVGACEPPFTSAGGHFNPGGAKHGFLAAEGLHAGDLPNIHVPPNGKLVVEMFNGRFSLNDTLFDEDGAAIVIHEGADDYQTDPAGAAGPRIACGVIEAM